ncbi:MAG: DUF3696 domain-containing protein [Polynucleobacter sp.]|uniref:AAA family ATPase n=1 Tax=Polynucleobacter sp. TaxID=2029855 RepID=UPI002728E52D|nr:DUF3696 domain-containing protein [Polynucleobacter sp.]MDO8714340.1 DUF3696 domain-containing protein [Polynucleobacter sp.]
MITSISIGGFKCFNNETISLGNLTVLTGLNNSGKSSCMQALRMATSIKDVHGNLIDGMGGYGELRSRFSEQGTPIEITVTLKSQETIKYSLDERGHKSTGQDLAPFIEFISADRYGPRVQLPILQEDDPRLTVGHFGQYAAHYASVLENVLITEALRHPSSLGNTLKHQLNWWMNEIAPGVKLNFDILKRNDSSTMSVDDFRPTNSGFGISYTLPIILSLLTMSGSMGENDSDWRVKNWFELLNKNNSLLLIENPEAHLHPRGQTNIGKLIALTSSLGVQIVVETHSDHVLDGIRLAVKENCAISNDDILIKYFEKSQMKEPAISEIKIQRDGKLDNWPSGFFDQLSINLRSLAMRQ